MTIQYPHPTTLETYEWIMFNKRRDQAIRHHVPLVRVALSKPSRFCSEGHFTKYIKTRVFAVGSGSLSGRRRIIAWDWLNRTAATINVQTSLSMNSNLVNLTNSDAIRSSAGESRKVYDMLEGTFLPQFLKVIGICWYSNKLDGFNSFFWFLKVSKGGST